ncbi:hypothetical protein J1N35_043774, partial [Gossypium stocksii]
HNNQLEEIPKTEQQDLKLGNLIGEEKDFSEEMLNKITKNHISKEEIYKISKFKIWSQRHIEKISGNTIAKDTKGGLTEILLFTKEKIKRIRKKYPQTKNSDIKDLAEDLAISWTAINEYTNTAEVDIKEVNNKIIELFEPNKITTEIQPKLLHLKDLSILKDWIIGDINNTSTSKPRKKKIIKVQHPLHR